MVKLSIILAVLLSISCASNTTRFVIIPDTQSVFETDSTIMRQQMEWIADPANKVDFAIHVGDITQSNSDDEWSRSREYFEIIAGKVPFTFSLGNHDFGSAPNRYADVRDSRFANRYMGIDFINSVSSPISTYPENSVDNMAHLVDLNGDSWLIISMEFGPRDKTLDWADRVILNHPSSKVIINTHAYLYCDSTRIGDGDNWSPHGYGIGKSSDGANDGDQIWNKLVKNHKNIEMVFSGHILKSGVGTLSSVGVNGNRVYQMLANYQRGVKGMGKGDNGYLRIVDYSESNKTIDVKTYSPVTGHYITTTAHNFTLPLD